MKRVSDGDFLEHAHVHGSHYGTLRETVLFNLDRGVDVLLDVDVQGAAMIRASSHKQIQAAIADVFLMPPSMEELRRRLLTRGTETPEQFKIRMEHAEAEIKARHDYRYTLVSGSPEEDFQNFRSIMIAERFLTPRVVME